MFLKELSVAFGGLVVQFEAQFSVVALQLLSEEQQKERHPAPVVTAEAPGGWNVVSSTTPGSAGMLAVAAEVTKGKK